MGSQVKADGRAVNWSHPLNPTHLPPKCPSLYSLGSSMFDSPAGMFVGRTSYSNHVVGQKQHQRTPSTGFLPQVQPSWLEDGSDVTEVPCKRSLHRRSASDSVAFLEVPGAFSKIDFHIAEEDEFDAKNSVIMQGGSTSNFDKLDEEQLMCMFGDIEPFQRPTSQLAECHQHVMSANNAASSSFAESWSSERRTPASTPENPSTPSDSNSHSEVSNDDIRSGALGRVVSEPEVQSIDEGDESSQQPLTGDLISATLQIDPNLDPKRAKRILANRQSAQRSRVRKLQYISELERSVSALQTEVATLSPQVAYLDHQRVVLNMDNNALKQQIATLVQDKRFKDAHYEALRKEAQRLRALQQQQQQQHQLQQASPSCTFELQQQQFSKLDLGTPQSDTKSSGQDTFLVKSVSGLSSLGAAASRTSGRTQASKGIATSTCTVAVIGKNSDGRTLTGSTRLPPEFLLQNP